MKIISYVMPEREVVLEVNNIAYWFMKKFGFRMSSKPAVDKIRGRKITAIIYDEYQQFSNPIKTKEK